MILRSSNHPVIILHTLNVNIKHCRIIYFAMIVCVLARDLATDPHIERFLLEYQDKIYLFLWVIMSFHPAKQISALYCCIVFNCLSNFSGLQASSLSWKAIYILLSHVLSHYLSLHTPLHFPGRYI